MYQQLYFGGKIPVRITFIDWVFKNNYRTS